jgi:putative ABC transport system permease protein
MASIYLKLAFAGLRRRRLQTALTVVVVAAAAAALTIALGIGRVADRPFERTVEATNAPHVTALARTAAELRPLERLPGVVESSGVRGMVFTAFRHDDELFGLRVVETSPAARVPRLLLDEGSAPGPGQVVLERSFALFLGLGPGDRLAAGRERVPLRVSGIAVVSMGQAYPLSQPGLGFALTGTLARIEPDRDRWRSALGLRLAEPEAADAFVLRAASLAGPRVDFDAWTWDRADVSEDVRTVQIIISLFSVMLLLAGGAVLATLIGGRVLTQVRTLGLLKAAGLTPAQVARVLLLEQLALGVVGAAIGIVLGTIATPLFVSESAALLNASQTPSLTVGTVVIVVAVTLLAVTLFTVVPAWRAGRRTTAGLLAETPTAGARLSGLTRLADRLRLGVPTALGVRGSFARPGRAAITTLSLALTVAAVVATLGMEASLRVATEPPVAPTIPGFETPAWDPVDDDAGEADRLRPIVYGLDAILLFVGVVNLVATLLLGVRERVRDLGLLKAVGLTPRQVTSSFLASQALLGILAAAIGIPLGLALFRLGIQLDGSTDEFSYPWWWSLALLVPAAVAAIVALSAPLARRAAEIRVTDALRYE